MIVDQPASFQILEKITKKVNMFGSEKNLTSCPKIDDIKFWKSPLDVVRAVNMPYMTIQEIK